MEKKFKESHWSVKAIKKSDSNKEKNIIKLRTENSDDLLPKAVQAENCPLSASLLLCHRNEGWVAQRQGRKVKIIILNPAVAQYQSSIDDTKITILDILLSEDIFRYTI